VVKGFVNTNRWARRTLQIEYIDDPSHLVIASHCQCHNATVRQ